MQDNPSVLWYCCQWGPANQWGPAKSCCSGDTLEGIP